MGIENIRYKKPNIRYKTPNISYKTPNIRYKAIRRRVAIGQARNFEKSMFGEKRKYRNRTTGDLHKR